MNVRLNSQIGYMGIIDGLQTLGGCGTESPLSIYSASTAVARNIEIRTNATHF